VNHGFWERAGGDTGQKYCRRLSQVVITALRAISLGLIRVLLPAPTQTFALRHSLFFSRRKRKETKRKREGEEKCPRTISSELSIAELRTEK
jgi:hypothetical protein